MVSIGMCDDDEAELANLGALALAYARRRGVRFDIARFRSGEDLLAAIEKGATFDIVFLDVYMGITNGVEVARELREFDPECIIVFATNSREHAIDGYGVRALQYLLKPLGERNVSMALDEALESLAGAEERFIRLANKGGLYKVALGEIVYAESDARVVTVHRRGRDDLSFYMRLDELERLCDDGRFLRCHKSFLVNLDYVHAVSGRGLLLETGEEVRYTLGAQEVKSRFAAHVARGL